MFDLFYFVLEPILNNNIKVKCDLHSRIPIIKSSNTFHFYTHSITVLVYDHTHTIIKTSKEVYTV